MRAGVQWGVLCCLTPAGLDGDGPLSTARLAASVRLSAAGLDERRQVPARAGILRSTPATRGGFRLARPPERIALRNVVVRSRAPKAPSCVPRRADGGPVPGVREEERVTVWHRHGDAQGRAGLATGLSTGPAA
ncbi:Rrf2 family transcriptional regulator [Streptomyces angustmyceticus]|uniref:Rrf2 family transcriptional regulator n=1 Tax=Streptomyces angustmyceticus TaxID=285578 RepID=UPI0028BEA111|nr:Rrf2 family transcriptional regulator [Streptomyces angustmyceticus]